MCLAGLSCCTLVLACMVIFHPIKMTKVLTKGAIALL